MEEGEDRGYHRRSDIQGMKRATPPQGTHACAGTQGTHGTQGTQHYTSTSLARYLFFISIPPLHILLPPVISSAPLSLSLFFYIQNDTWVWHSSATTYPVLPLSLIHCLLWISMLSLQTPHRLHKLLAGMLSPHPSLTPLPPFLIFSLLSTILRLFVKLMLIATSWLLKNRRMIGRNFTPN